ncbi:MAG TPA: class I SAM-dependent methyltransferase [Cytophagaceae bacterium]|nr:class I SAM-dependent methyltransferase [Cytophagaceae bacterium]
MNEKNFDFYRNLGVDPFKKLAVVGGFNSFTDLELTYPFVKHSESILELGAGYGRCLDFFIAKEYTGKLIAVEQSDPLVKYLKQHYSSRVEILQEDIKTLELKEKVDAALWMWSGIIDFSKEEQLNTTRHIVSLLNHSGRLVVDTPRIGFQTFATHSNDHTIHLDSSYGTLDCYIPDEKEMRELKEKLNMKQLDVIHYLTATDKQRTLYILTK